MSLSQRDSIQDFERWVEAGHTNQRLWLAPGADQRFIRAVVDGLTAPAEIVEPALMILRAADKKLWEAADRGVVIGDLYRLIKAFASPLGLFVLAHCFIPNPTAELLLTKARQLLLLELFAASDGFRPGKDKQRFAVALAEHCFLNDYCFGLAVDESLPFEILSGNLNAAIAEGETPDAHHIAVLACYAEPLSFCPMDRLLSFSSHRMLQALIARTVVNVLRDRELAAEIPQLSAVRDATSQAVREMYEKNPYPRWSLCERRQPFPLAAALRQEFPRLDVEGFGNPATPRTLIAGCGTGQHVVRFCNTFGGADVTAIDLSRASLAYAKRKTDELGLCVTYAQADILELGAWDSQFDVIDCLGVLHHLADPAVGLRTLLTRLRPGGVMRIGLYSFAAREMVRDAWRYIQQRGFNPTASDIRRFRQEVFEHMRAELPLPLRFVSLVELLDFYSLSMCRDLAFHVQEKQFSIRETFRTIDECDVHLLGFYFNNPSLTAAYLERFPGDPYLTSRTSLEAYEDENPAAFLGMIQFGIQKRT